MTLSEKKVMASHCTKDGEKMEQRPSPVLAERKRTLELSPCSSSHAQHHQAGKLPRCNISALTSILVTQLSLQMPGRDAPGAIKVLPCVSPHSSEGSWDINSDLWDTTGSNTNKSQKGKEKEGDCMPRWSTAGKIALGVTLQSTKWPSFTGGKTKWLTEWFARQAELPWTKIITMLQRKEGPNNCKVVSEGQMHLFCREIWGTERRSQGLYISYSTGRLQTVKFGVRWVSFDFTFNLQRP